MRLPDVIGIGTRRCGSSWVHQALNLHPDLGKPANGLHFFSQHFNKGVPWYGEQLAPHADRPVLSEFSVSYLYPEHHEAVAERIASSMGRAKLFVCVRDPVERAFSDYLRSIRNAEYPADLPFEAALERDPVLIDRGRFGRLLRPFVTRFGVERVKVMFYEDLETNRRAYIAELIAFFGLERPVPEQAFERHEPKGKAVRSEAVNRLIRGTKQLVDGTAEKLGLEDAWSNWKAERVSAYERLLELNHTETTMSVATSRRLRAELSQDIAELEAITGRSLEAWRRG